MNNYKPAQSPLVLPTGLKADINHKISQHHRSAILWIEKNWKAYLPGKIKNKEFGRQYKIVVDNKEKHFILTTYNHCYGKMQYANQSGWVNHIGWPKQTFCTMNVSTQLWYFMKCYKVPILTYKKARKKHPIYWLCQRSANENVRRFRKNKMNYGKYKFQKVHKHTAYGHADNGVLAIACWENKEGPGHLSVLIGDPDNRTEEMTYNIGSTNGYMTLEAAFGELRLSELEYYILMEKE